MRLYLYQRTPTSNFYLRGTDAEGGKIFESTKTTHRPTAEAKRIKREGELLQEVVHGKKAVVTFDEAVVSYIAAGGDTRFLGKYDEATGETSGLTGKLMGVKLRTITQSRLDEIALELLPNVLPDTRNRQVYTPFVAVWNHAVGNEWADFRKWRRPKKPKGTRTFKTKKKRVGSFPTTYDRAVKFVTAMAPSNAIVMTILFYTGMRPIELFLMDREQVSVPKRWITLPSSKTGEPRGVPMHEFLVPLMRGLLKRKDGTRLVRTWEGEPWTVVEGNGGQMKKGIKNARSRTGILDIAPYTARHTVSTQLVVNGIHAYIKDQILGHVVDDTSHDYVDVPEAERIRAINTLPTFKEWAEAPWMTDPLRWESQRLKPLTKKQKAKMVKLA
jgi:integrase